MDAVNKEVFDRVKLIAGMMGDEGLAREIARASLVDFRSQARVLGELCETGNGDEVKRFLHSMKGVAAHACCGLLHHHASVVSRLFRERAESEARLGLRMLEGPLGEAIAVLEDFIRFEDSD